MMMYVKIHKAFSIIKGIAVHDDIDQTVDLHLRIVMSFKAVRRVCVIKSS